MKEVQYFDLVKERKQCRACDGLQNPGSQEFAELDSLEIGPWSILHGDLDAPLMIVGQDWGDTRAFQAQRGLDDLHNPILRTLEKLLVAAGATCGWIVTHKAHVGCF